METISRMNSWGDEFWYNLSNKLHREDGPAVIFANGRQRWYLEGELVTKARVLNTPTKKRKWRVMEVIRKL